MFGRTSNPFKAERPKPKKKRSTQPVKDRAVWAALAEDIEELRKANARILPGTWNLPDANEFSYALVTLIERDSDSAYLYKPLKVGDEFHQCMCHEVGLSGSNRAGKTIAASAEVGMAAMGLHYVKEKYPKDKVQIACVGNDGRHLSLMYEYLFEKAPYRIYQHPVTMIWSIVDENCPEANKYKHLWEEAKPFIPERMVQEVAWEDKKEKIPSLVRLYNGTVIRFYSGLVKKLPQGRKFHLVWIDEEIENPKRWIEEMRARIVDYNGRIFWSATPQRASQEFFDMELKATDPENEDKPLSQKTAFFVMRSTDNIYISKEGNEAFLAKMKDDDEQLQTRWFGQSARSFLTVYPEYGEHNLINDYNPRYEDTNYIIIDPGVDVAGVLFAVCPQQEQHYNYDRLSEEEKWYRSRPDCLVIYDELYIKRANPDMVAEAIKNKRLQYPVTWLQDLTIDQRGGKSMIWRGMGKDESCEGLYMSALKRYEVLPRPENVDRWQYGSSDIKFGVDKTKTMLVKGFDKLPRLFIHRRCKKLMWEFKAWQKKRDSRGEFIGYQEGNNHLLDCLRYATTRELKWVSPPESMKHKPIDLRQTMADLKSGKSFFT